MHLFNQLYEFLVKLNIDYAICGGHAIDLYIGYQTRPHKDLDVSVYWEDRDKIVSRMLDMKWDIYEPCGCEHLHKINSVSDQKRIKSNIWCVLPSNSHYKFRQLPNDMYEVCFDNSEQTNLNFIEFLFNSHKSGLFLYSRNNEISLNLSDAIKENDQIKYLAPELILLYKSTASGNPEYQLDFNNTLPLLGETQLKWLTNALKIMNPDGHSWVAALERTN